MYKTNPNLKVPSDLLSKEQQENKGTFFYLGIVVGLNFGLLIAALIFVLTK